MQIEFDLPVLAAVLAVIGYSLNDTIVVFDRIRENFRKMRKGTPESVMNRSINQTLARTLMTSLTTLLVPHHRIVYNKAAGAKYRAAGMPFRPGFDENQPLNMRTDLRRCIRSWKAFARANISTSGSGDQSNGTVRSVLMVGR